MLNNLVNMNLVRISMPSIVIKTVCLPLFGMFFSVVWSILFEWESSTATHCRVSFFHNQPFTLLK